MAVGLRLEWVGLLTLWNAGGAGIPIGSTARKRPACQMHGASALSVRESALR
ncbi:hypothetical protein GCM10029963_31360 [Micromonospora andamanensis]|uniref:Uncharacterized protein n=1 Tax=Micromonospora andamanensis TaxID=1287068 RepID=A0ABQ4HN61_9ACTN|nr:hypothetical protein Van01_02930 [Micromonospora andamanensis]GIJ40401.1 hypothetical protein Vwe01_37260 [Micromonospora andamanensis]